MSCELGGRGEESAGEHGVLPDEEPTENLQDRIQEKMCKCDFIVGVASRPPDRKSKWMRFAKGGQNTNSVKVGSMKFEYLGKNKEDGMVLPSEAKQQLPYALCLGNKITDYEFWAPR